MSYFKQCFSVVIVFFIGCQNLFGSTVWKDLQVDFTYQDSATNCSSVFAPVPAFTLLVEMDGSEVLSAQIVKAASLGKKGVQLRLRKDEYQNIQTFAEAGEEWVSRLTLSKEAVIWLVLNSRNASVECRPSESFATMGPENHDFVFRSFDALVEAYAFSGWVSFHGLTISGKDYEMRVRLLQSRKID